MFADDYWRRRERRRMTPNGKRHYQIDYDRGALIREGSDGRRLHRYSDENFWRDEQGNPVEQTLPSN